MPFKYSVFITNCVLLQISFLSEPHSIVLLLKHWKYDCDTNDIGCNWYNLDSLKLYRLLD